MRTKEEKKKTRIVERVQLRRPDQMKTWKVKKNICPILIDDGTNTGSRTEARQIDTIHSWGVKLNDRCWQEKYFVRKRRDGNKGSTGTQCFIELSLYRDGKTTCTYDDDADDGKLLT